ncbi:PREDICTED: uncharacterized protein LOC101300379 [Fragaria vesca subsp. vesca]
MTGILEQKKKLQTRERKVDFDVVDVYAATPRREDKNVEIIMPHAFTNMNTRAIWRPSVFFIPLQAASRVKEFPGLNTVKIKNNTIFPLVLRYCFSFIQIQSVLSCGVLECCMKEGDFAGLRASEAH